MKYFDWRMDAVRAGRGYHVDVGAFSTPIVGGGAGTIITIDKPEFVLGVPAGTVIIPTRIHVVCEPPLIAADDNEIEILIAANIAAVPVSYGTATAETPTNMHTGSSNTSGCTCKSATTGAITSPTLGMELAHAVKVADIVLTGTAANAFWEDLSLLYEPITPPILVGPCTLLVYWGGTVATSGYAQVEWIEMASA